MRASAAAGTAEGGFLGWWLGELEEMFPRRHGGRTKPPRRFAVLFMEAGRLHLLVRDGRRVKQYGSIERVGLEEGGATRTKAALATGIGRVRRGKLPVVLRLSPDEAVVAEDVLPKAALSDLRLVVGHKLDLLTPFTPQQAYFDAVPLESVGRDRVAVVVVAVPKPRVEEGLRLARALGLEPGVVDIADDGPAEPPQMDLLGTTAPKKRGPNPRLLWPFLVLLPLALGGAAYAYQDMYARHGLLEQRGGLAAALERQVGDLPALEDRLTRLRREGGFVARQRQGQPSALVALESLSRLLPDDVWLDSLSLDGDRLALTGYAPDASELVPLLENAPAFAGVAFQAPSTRVEVSQGGATVPAERFSVAARVSPRRDLR